MTLIRSFFLGFLFSLILFSSLSAAPAPASEPNWSEFVKGTYPQWSKHYWTDREMWGNRGYIVQGPIELQARQRGVSIAPLDDDANLRGIDTAGKVRTYTVKKGDCLWYIAGYREIYSNPLRWPLIFKANSDQIRDPDLIYPGQVFVIPEE